jgi:hypothetical protein
MENSSFFREQAEKCLRRARNSPDPVLQKTLRTLSDDCTAFANELEDQEIASSYSDDNWPVSKTKKTPERTWSAIQLAGFAIVLTMPSIATLTWMVFKERVGL